MARATTLRRVVSVARDRNLTFLAASVAYYAFVSLLPLAVLTVVVGSLVGGEAFADSVVSQFGSLLSASGQQVLRRALTNSTGRTGAGAVGTLMLVWSATKLFRGLDVAFSEAYGTTGDPSFLEKILDGILTVSLVAVSAGLMVGAGYLLQASAVDDLVPFGEVVETLVFLATLAVVFLPLYYILPPVEMTVRRAVPGAVVAAVGWFVLQLLFQWYVTAADKYAAYGFLGAILLLATWLYFAGVVVLGGAVVNAVLSGRS